ncbi:SgcJ/EcaC family oxidoreductase [Micromonospora sp. NPDC003197]
MSTSDAIQPIAAEQIAAIRQLVADAEKHQNDPEPFLALHTAETIIVNIAGRRVLGRDALRQAMTAALASPLAQVRTRQEIVDVRFPAPGVALVSCTKHVSDDRDPGGKDTSGASLPNSGSLTYLLVEEQGAWRIAVAQTTPIMGA